MSGELDDLSLFDLFRMEAEEQVLVLQKGLLALESGDPTSAQLESLMRAAHSIKGAARIVGLDAIVQLTHVLEDRFVAAQQGLALTSGDVSRALAATDWLAKLQTVTEAETSDWLAANTPSILAFAQTFSQPDATPGAPSAPTPPPAAPLPPAPAPQAPPPTPEHSEPDVFARISDAAQPTLTRDIRIAASRFDHMMSLTSETLVASRIIAGHAVAFERRNRALARTLQQLEDPQADLRAGLRELSRHAAALTDGIADFDQIARGQERIAEDLYRSVLGGRLRPFADGVRSAARLVRDTAHNLGKQVRLEILGETTQVDREVLERLEAPISHLITNALDHGIELPHDRIAQGKPAEARLTLQARHDNGRLVISLQDDGRGIDPEALRERVVLRGLVTPDTAKGLTEPELLEFLFLPGFSTRDAVTDVSGRGVGLSVVQSMVQQAGGSVDIRSSPNTGTRFRLTLPVARSVIRVLRVLIDGERYAIPLVRIDRVARVTLQSPTGTDPRPSAEIAGAVIPVVPLAPLLGLPSQPLPTTDLPIILCDGIAFAVDELVDETELPVRRLDPRLGKIPGVSAASLDEAGHPLLILDIPDLVQTALGHAAPATTHSDTASGAPHILVVDDSHTVREIERRLLTKLGYRVSTAQNGREAWNLLRLNDYDLLITDVDMPQMNGIELVVLLRANPRLMRLPVIILSYKDRAEDRTRGLEAGADFYLTKGDFDNDRFHAAVVDLIGTASGTE